MPAVAVSQTACRDDQIHLRGDWGQARFTVDVADDNAERAQGLMNVEEMAQSAGMLFVYDRPRVVRFWMRNTLIPLDMIFADRKGIVRYVHHEAEPLSEDLIYGGNNIQYVLEVNGGLARQLGIARGSEMRHPAIAGDEVAWSCTTPDE
ncbi:DUF192 domain-containing protein [Roseovarius aestuariivivens]|uniref:DUF192 domain-containing protein n=1 Tax=Roseovarius aestuariivivens TaxID=1888910 RepID=UPI001FD99384|nr:DUF192 domain-containing protein [Roseovarius aestuariivivens]